MVAEPTQEKGRDGVYLTKRWLEATTFIRLPFVVYEDPGQCEVELLDGNVKKFDLFGYIYSKKTDNRKISKRPLYVENKAYNDAGNQRTDYSEFLANAYSSTKRMMESNLTYNNMEFMWVTTYPFENINEWKKLVTLDRVKAAIESNRSVLNGGSIDEDVVRDLLGKIWILVFSPKQEELMMETSEIKQVLTILDRGDI